MKTTNADMPEPAPLTALLRPDAPWAPGLRVGAWTLDSRLHVGPSSEVWSARGRGMPDVVVKRLSAELTHDEGARARLIDEVRIGSLLRHGNLARLVMWDVDAPVQWLAFERLRGATLTQVLKRAKASGAAVPAGAALWLAQQAALGLQAAHETRDEDGHFLSVVHRDVCPDNLFVTESGEVRVLDFGIASAKERLARTVTGQQRGRLVWAAPEQLRGVDVDARADQFSLGAVLFELLTGRTHVSGVGAEALLRELTVDDAPFPRVDALAPSVPRPVADVVATMLERSAERRFDSMGEVAMALGGFIEDQRAARRQLAALVPTTAGATSRRSGWWLAAAAVALGLGAALAWPRVDAAPTPPAAPVAVSPPPREEPAPEPEPVKLPAPAQVPERGRFAFVTRPATTVWFQGRRLGETPLELSLPTGRQRVRLVEEATQRVQWLSLDVAAGRGARVDVELEALKHE